MNRPNILLLYTDQQRWDALRANGNSEIKTPNLDRLADESVNFNRYFVQAPVCMPSRVSFLTSRYCSTLGIETNGVPVSEDVVTLPHMLHNYGYRSGNIGKLHFLNHANRDHRLVHPSYGFDHLEISDEPGSYEDAYRAWVRRVAPDQIDNVSLGLPPATEVWQKTMGVDDGIVHPETRFSKSATPFPGDSGVTHTAFVAEQTMAFMEQHRDAPFFCVGGFYSPHEPWVAPQEFLDLYDPDSLALPTFPPEIDAQRSDERFSDAELRSARQGYYGMVSEVDHHVGRILDRLDVLGMRENTIVVFTSDHGEWLGEHLRYGKGYPGHDVVSRVPMMVRWPERFPQAGETVSAIVEAVDVVPTLLELAGIQVPYEVQGKSFAGLLEGRTESHRDSALVEGPGWKGLRIDGFRYVVEKDGKESLFDLNKPLGDYENVAGEDAYASVLGEVRVELLRRLIEIERPIPREWAY